MINRKRFAQLADHYKGIVKGEVAMGSNMSTWITNYEYMNDNVLACDLIDDCETVACLAGTAVIKFLPDTNIYFDTEHDGTPYEGSWPTANGHVAQKLLGLDTEDIFGHQHWKLEWRVAEVNDSAKTMAQICRRIADGENPEDFLLVGRDE